MDIHFPPPLFFFFFFQWPAYTRALNLPNSYRQDNEFSVLADSAQDIFYNDLPAEQRAYWFSQCSRSHSFHTKKAKATHESWLEIPTHYLVCEDDQAIPLPQQEFMTGMVKEKGGEIQTTRFKSSHSPFLSRPEETVEWIRRVAGEEI